MRRHAVTGAFGCSGRYLAQRLLDAGEEVITLTNSWQRPNPFGDRLPAHLFHFDQPKRLIETLGRRYTSELARRRDRATAYASN
jgi:NADH dehydrogenase